MIRTKRFISIAALALCCTLTYFAFAANTALAAGPVPQQTPPAQQKPSAPQKTPAPQKPPAQQKPPAPKKPPTHQLVCPATLHYNDRGNDVKKLQAALNRQGYKDPHNRPLAVNGVFDNATVAAVKNLEAKHHLKVDGVAGSSVWQVLGQCTTR